MPSGSFVSAGFCYGFVIEYKGGSEMNNKERKKELQSQYSAREVIGGVYLIRNTHTNRILLDAAVDLQGSRNRFEFAQKTGSCVYLKLNQDWSAQENSHFRFEILEEVKKGEGQTQEEFKADIALLKDLWQEKLADEVFY